MPDWLVKPRYLLPQSAPLVRLVLFAGCCVATLLLAGPQGSGQLPRTSPTPDASGQVPGTPEDEMQRQMMKKQEQRRNEERQKELVRDTDKLLALATDLKADVDKTNKDVLSIEVVKRADEIEKLARSVKDRMRSR